MFHIKAPVLLITTAEPKNIKLFFFTSVIVFVWAHRFSICCYLVLYSALHQPPVFFLISFYSILFSVQLCRKVVISSLSTYIHTQERYDSTWNILCVLFFVSVGVSPCVWLPRGRMQSADANFVICLDWAVADGASGRLRHRCFRAGWGAHERQALSPCGQRVSTRMWWSKTSGMRKGGGGAGERHHETLTDIEWLIEYGNG